MALPAALSLTVVGLGYMRLAVSEGLQVSKYRKSGVEIPEVFLRAFFFENE